MKRLIGKLFINNVLLPCSSAQEIKQDQFFLILQFSSFFLWPCLQYSLPQNKLSTPTCSSFGILVTMVGKNAARTDKDKRVNKNWVVDMEERYQSYGPDIDQYYLNCQRKRCIYRWPNDLVIASGMLWHHTPHMASFGPYHHGEDHLQLMEHHKERALYKILNRSGVSLYSLISSLEGIKQELMDSYDNLDPELSSDLFLRMMLLDGCFMLELLRTADPDRVEPYETVFNRAGMVSITVVQRDMLMLENQIPLLVVKKLLEVETSGGIDADAYLNQLIFSHYGFQHPPISEIGSSLHILDAYRKRLIIGGVVEEERPPSIRRFLGHYINEGLNYMPLAILFLLLAIPFLLHWIFRGRNLKPGYVRSATRFHEAGIEFKKRRLDSGLKITFDRKRGLLTLPYIDLDDYTAAIYMNLIAFERVHPELRNNQDVTSYVTFMYNLIDTAEDVSLLSSKGVLRNQLGSNNCAAEVFNKMADGIPNWPDEQLHEDLRSYAASDWNAARAYMNHVYFKNTWTTMSLFAAIVLLALYSVLAVKSGK
ncbi:hypothetical protein EJ110_NYTH46908 [Nymphaea thermarum]|nr:hypothetical protein EJ110_NYTH46908 [Nymphaea thermarum]